MANGVAISGAITTGWRGSPGIRAMHGAVDEGGHTHTEITYTVSGRMAPTGTAWDRAILVPIRAVWQLHGMAGDEAHEHGHEHEHGGGSLGLGTIITTPTKLMSKPMHPSTSFSGRTLPVFPPCW